VFPCRYDLGYCDLIGGLAHSIIVFVLLYREHCTSAIHALSLHDALPILILATTPAPTVRPPSRIAKRRPSSMAIGAKEEGLRFRSEEHTSELQSRENLVCRLLLEKKRTRTASSRYFSAITTENLISDLLI